MQPISRKMYNVLRYCIDLNDWVRRIDIEKTLEEPNLQNVFENLLRLELVAKKRCGSHTVFRAVVDLQALERIPVLDAAEYYSMRMRNVNASNKKENRVAARMTRAAANALYKGRRYENITRDDVQNTRDWYARRGVYV